MQNYSMDYDYASEIVLLIRMQNFLREHLPLLPDVVPMEDVWHVLDVRCGPGQWIMDMARRHPDVRFMGIDPLPDFVDYARFSARNRCHENVHFTMGDLYHLSRQRALFDVVHIQGIAPLVGPRYRQQVIADIVHTCKPGGTVVWQECYYPETSSPACNRWCKLLHDAIEQAGGTPDPVEEMEHLLRRASCETIERIAVPIDLSTGTPAHGMLYCNIAYALNVLNPFLLKNGIIGAQDLEDLRQQMVKDIFQSDFRGMGTIVIVLGTPHK
jgi:ubiquinone/menaquinone biosynthesis C-methylase UbiE